MNGGERIASVLERHGVRFLFTLCGGHISPILVAAKARGIRIVDVRDEVSAVFAADAVARLTGIPGVAAVTAGPGVTNTITAIKNAQLAQSPVVLLGGATGTILKGRGSLQDIDQMALVKPHVKWAGTCSRVRDLAPQLERAFFVAREGVPGPVFLECPVDLLYDEKDVRALYAQMGGGGKGIGGKLLGWYLERHLNKLFAGAGDPAPRPPQPPAELEPGAPALRNAARRLARAERPVVMVGSQAMLEADRAEAVAEAVEALGCPVYLSGMARGLLGRGHPLQMRHKRRDALKEADFVLLAGVPNDFRLDYGRQISGKAVVVAANRSRAEMTKNRRPTVGVRCDAGRFLTRLAAVARPRPEWDAWRERLAERDRERNEQIAEQARAETEGEGVNPLEVCRAIEEVLPENGVLVADGGDFVATASYITAPRGPLTWLDPGVFGTLGVGGGFAVGAALARPDSQVWLIWGDGSAAYSLAEIDSFVRHGLGMVAVIGTDASWAQIAREQVEMLGDEVGTVLRRSDYHLVAEGYGGVGIKVETAEEVRPALERARELAGEGRAVVVNVMLGGTDFRKGSISM